MEDNNNASMFSDGFVPVTESEKLGWHRISFIWMGSSLSVPTIMVGAIMMDMMNIYEMLISVVCGSLFLLMIFAGQGMMGHDTGLPTVMNAHSAFGKSGAKTVISLIIAITFLGWTGNDCEIAGSSFSEILNLNSISISPKIVILVLGLIMLVGAIYGEKFLSILSLVCVPLLLLLCAYGIYYSSRNADLSGLFADKTISLDHLVPGISLTIGMGSAAATISADYHRFAKSRSQSNLAAAVGLVPTCLFLYTSGAIMGYATGETDISILISKMGLPIIGLFILIFATWTTMASDAYVAGLAFTSLLRMPGNKRSLATAIAGVIGIVLAMVGFLSYFTNFLDLLASAIPPLAGVMMADYWFKFKGSVDGWREQMDCRNFNWAGIISWVLGSAGALLINWGFNGVNGIVIAFVGYIVLDRVMNKPAVKNEAA